MPAVRCLAPHFAALLVLLAIFPASAGAASASREQRQEMFGLGGWAWPNSGEIAALSGKGLRSWRVTMSWADIEAHRGQRIWSGYDRLVQDLASRHVQAIFTLTACPRWACDHGGRPAARRGRSAWVDFVRAAVRRYGVGGALWREHPGLPAKPVIHWQVLNEVNGPDQWGGPPERRGLRRLPQAHRFGHPWHGPEREGRARRARREDAVWLRDYLPALYRQPGFAADFDVMAVEGYARVRATCAASSGPRGAR